MKYLTIEGFQDPESCFREGSNVQARGFVRERLRCGDYRAVANNP